MIQPVAIIEKLDGIRIQWWLFTTLCTFVLVGILSLLLLALFILVDSVVTLPTTLLQLGFVVWCAVSVGLLAVAFYRAIRSQRSLEAAARRVEMTFPQLENSLISLVQWNELTDPPGGFQLAAIRESAERAAAVPMEETACHQTRWQRWQLGLQTPRDLIEWGATLAITLGVLVMLSQIPQWAHSTDRFLNSFLTDLPAAAIESGRNRPSNFQRSTAVGEIND